MSAYQLVKLLIELNVKTNEELLIYCEAYHKTNKLNDSEYEELLELLK